MTKAATDFLQELRNRTEPFHKSIEQLPISSSILSKEVTLRNYRDYLIVLYPFVKEFEASVYPQVQHVVADLESRKKTALLFNDLQSLGIQPEELDIFDDVFFKQNDTVAGALGCSYVLEGSTLGGQFISRHLEKVLGENVTGSLGYLKAYTTKTGSMWKNFLNTFCELTVREGHQDEAITSSIGTFQLLEKWMIKQSIFLLKA